MGNIPLWDYARFTRDSSHHRAFWNALDDALTPGQKARIASGGDLRGIWEAQPAEAAPAAPTGTDWLTPCRRIVQEFEGCRLQAYPDPGTGGDPWTIGWGHTGPDVRQGVKWTQQQSDATLDAELSEFRSHLIRLLPMAPRWSGAQQAALVSFAFNVGAGALEDSTLRRRLLAGEDPATVVREELLLVVVEDEQRSLVLWLFDHELEVAGGSLIRELALDDGDHVDSESRSRLISTSSSVFASQCDEIRLHDANVANLNLLCNSHRF